MLSDHHSDGGFCACCGTVYPCPTIRRALQSRSGAIRGTGRSQPDEASAAETGDSGRRRMIQASTSSGW
jgi:hypothetical protein